MSKDPLKSPDMYFNRELSWLEFNDRVLRQGMADDVPLMERLKFLAIVSSNLDEFFLVRVAGLVSARAEGVRRRDPAGMTPAAQLKAVGERVHRMVREQCEGAVAALAQLAEAGITIVPAAQWTDQQRQFLQAYFSKEVLPVLTPLAVAGPSSGAAAAGVAMAPGRAARKRCDGEEKIAVTAVPQQIARWVRLPGEEVVLARLDEVMAASVGALFPGTEILATALFRITRDADVSVERDETDDMLEAVERAVLTRQRRPPVRLQITPGADPRIRGWLDEQVKLQAEEVYEMEALLDAAALMELANWPGFEKLKNVEWQPQPPRDLLGSDDLFEAVADHDVLLFHPYETFDPVVRLVEQAADDPGVLAIKQTLYRTSGNSPIVRALGRAAQNGKEVTVLVELRARFDEARNIVWARRLEDLGAHVIYGIAGYKTHAKALLIVRRQAGRIQRYVHLATGNYNDRTARLYSDFGLMTCDRDIASDVAAFFNLLTGLSETVGWAKLAIAPTGLAAQVRRPDRARNAGLHARPAGPDHGQGQFAGGPR